MVNVFSKIGLIFVLLSVGLCKADGKSNYCDTLGNLQSQSEQGFPEHDVHNAVRALQADNCETLGTNSNSQIRCIWEFPINDSAANQKFEELNAGVTGCLGDNTNIERDAGVNHPDYFDAYSYESPEGTVYISIKNKAEFGQTLVSMTVR